MKKYIYTMGEGYKTAFDEAFGEQREPDTLAAPEPSVKVSVKPSAKAMPNQEQEKEEAPSFSGEVANPNGGEVSERVKTLSAEWNALGFTPFTKATVNLNHWQRQDLVNGLASYDNPAILSAMRNYQRVCNDPAFDPGGYTGYTFISFLTKGVERYQDEAKP